VPIVRQGCGSAEPALRGAALGSVPRPDEPQAPSPLEVNRATFEDPHRYPAGIHHVLVNGVSVIQDGAHTGARPGRALRRS